jgi:GNAT superfamily N-acetyltransferase
MACAPERLPKLAFRAATPSRWPDLEALFGRNGACAGCWCMFWKQTGPEFRAGKGEPNRRALRRIVKSGGVPGLLAYWGGEPVAWVAVEPRDSYARLAPRRQQRLGARSLAPVDDLPVWSVPCFFVARRWRGRGVGGQLLAAAAAHARRKGARLLEGYPVDSRRRSLADAWLYTGAYSTFTRQGFVEVARRARTRPIVRLALRRGAAVSRPR